MYHYHRLNNRTVQPYLALTVPELRPLLSTLDHVPTTEESNLLVAIGATFWGQPAGIAVADYHAASQQTALLELFVAPAYRQAGIGTTLLTHLETALQAHNCQTIRLVYQTDEHSDTLERLLHQQGWSEPEQQSHLFWATFRAGQLPWIDRAKLPAAYQIFPWNELTAEERQTIEARQQAEAWYPPLLSPFIRPATELCTLNSLGLRYQGQVVGWVLTQLQERDEELLYDILFVSPELQPLGTGIRLLAEAIRRQLHHNAPENSVCLCRVAPDNQPMLRFIERGFGPWLIHRAEERSAIKQL